MLKDLQYGFRGLIKRPGFTLVAVATLALGIGANTAIFSVVNAVLLRPLPYHNSTRLIAFFSLDSGSNRDTLSIPELQEYRDQMHSLEDLAGFQSQSVNLTGGERPDRVRGAFVSSNFFQVFNLSPVIGRTFATGDDQSGAENIVVVNQKLWRERLGADPNLSGKKLVLNGEPYSVVGVVPESFKNPFDPDVEVWLSMTRYPGVTVQQDSRFMIPLGHLRSGVTLAQAQTEANTVAARLAAAYPKENAGRGAQLELCQKLVIGNAGPMLWVLLVAVGLILLIACANLANLLLARGLARQKEIAVRAALGARRWLLVRQLLVETTVLSVTGGICGVLLAQWGLWALLKLPQTFVDANRATIDTRVLLFALLVSVATGWIFGLLPALHLTRSELQSFLKEGGRSSGAGARWNRLRAGFVVAQVALSVLLLIGAGLLIRSFVKLLQTDLGFPPENLLSLEYRLPRNKYNTDALQQQFHQQVMRRIQEVPGVKSVALIKGLPFSGNGGTTPIVLLDREIPPAGHEPQILFNYATANYFETIGIPFISGRLFNDHDLSDTQTVVLINRAMAERFWPHADPLGKQIKLPEIDKTATVIGVVGDAKHFWPDEEKPPQIYAAYTQQPGFFATVLIRTTVEPMSLAEQVRQAIWKVDPDQPMWKIRTLDSLVNRTFADRKFLIVLMGIFATLAAALTIIGLYGVVSYLVNQRTQEIGIRMALGAQGGQILGMVLRHGMMLVLLGVVIGLGSAWLLTRLMSTLLYTVSSTDPLTFAAISLLLGLVALLACYLPARRATKVDPLEALRYE